MTGIGYIWWKMLKRLVTVHHVDGIDFIDMRSGKPSDRSALQGLLGDAIHDIEWAGFGDLLLANLSTVVATDLSERAIPSIRGYFCNFQELEFDKRALACRLLWFAKYYEIKVTNSGRPNAKAVARACYEVEREFVNKFPDREKWLAFLAEHHRPG